MKTSRYDELARFSNQALEAILRSAAAPAPETVVGYEWRGYNLSAFAHLLGIRKFIKGFFVRNGLVEGYNIRVQQNGLTEPWLHQPSAQDPARYAFFVVTGVAVKSKDNFYPRALLLHYGASARNPQLGIERRLRDYLVQPAAENTDLLLGKAYLALGAWRVFSGFFVLERLRPANWVP